AAEGLEAEEADARRLDDHAAAGEEPLSLAVTQSDSEDSRVLHRALARGASVEEADSRAVSERRRNGRARVRRGGGVAALLSCAGVGVDAVAGGAARRLSAESADHESRFAEQAAAVAAGDDSAADEEVGIRVREG